MGLRNKIRTVTSLPTLHVSIGILFCRLLLNAPKMLGLKCQLVPRKEVSKKGKVHLCTGTEALYGSYSP